MKLHIVIYTLLVATLCIGCGGRIEMRQMQELEALRHKQPRVITTQDCKNLYFNYDSNFCTTEGQGTLR